MSIFKVIIEKIQKIEDHPNADRLDLMFLENIDFQIIGQKGTYKIGDLVVFFPVDSLIPDKLKESMELTYLSGKNSDRVKTVKLRNQFSQV